jgi:hypothetical protein
MTRSNHDRRPRARRLVVGVLLGAAVALSGPGAGASGRASDPVDAAMKRLEGRYAHYDVVAYEGDGMKTLIISYGFTDLDEVDGKLVATDSFCFSEHRSDQPIQVQMTDAATQAIRPVPIVVKVKVKDGRARLSRPETPTGIGVRLENPAKDPLPTDPNDPRIADDDGDGKPGVTARVVVSPELQGDIYLARREIFAYDVTEQRDGSLTGAVDDHSEQLVVGASNPVFLTQAQWTQHEDPSKNPIILEPVKRTWNCDTLRAERDELFPPTPEVDW